MRTTKTPLRNQASASKASAADLAETSRQVIDKATSPMAQSLTRLSRGRPIACSPARLISRRVPITLRSLTSSLLPSTWSMQTSTTTFRSRTLICLMTSSTISIRAHQTYSCAIHRTQSTASLNTPKGGTAFPKLLRPQQMTPKS